MSQSNGSPRVEAESLSYYYENLRILGWILGSQRKARSKRKAGDASASEQTPWELFRAWGRFTVILAIFISLLYAACRISNILKTHGAVVGFLDDYVNYGIWMWMFAGMPIFLLTIRRLDSVLVSMPGMIDAGKDPKGLDALIKEAIGIREFISVRTPRARLLYNMLFCLGIALNLVYAAAIPLLEPWIGPKEQSWALRPYQYPLPFLLAQPWAFFWCTVVFVHYVWLIFSIILVLFRKIYVYGRQNRIVVTPLAVDERGGLRALGELVLLVMLLASGGLFIAVTWSYIFEPNAHTRGLVILYSVILACLYLLPIWFLHTAMKNARKIQLVGISILFAAPYLALLKSVNPGDIDPASVSGADSDRLASRASDISRIFAHVDGMPKWPVGMFTNILGTAVPALPFFAAMSRNARLMWDLPWVQSIRSSLQPWWEWLLAKLSGTG